MEKLREYFVMLNVRHPLQRLESLYRSLYVKYLVPKEARLRNRTLNHVALFRKFLSQVFYGPQKVDQHIRPYLEQDVCTLDIRLVPAQMVNLFAVQ